MAGVGLDEVERLSRELGRPIDVDRSALIMMARIAVHKEDGEDYMRSPEGQRQPGKQGLPGGVSEQYFNEEECAVENQHPGPAPAQPLPWKEYVNPWAEDKPEQEQYDTPRAIYGYLDRLVWKQDAAKRAAAVISFNAFKRGVKSNALFIGPSGCGKTHIWRCLQKIFPGRIVIEGMIYDAYFWCEHRRSPALDNSREGAGSVQGSEIRGGGVPGPSAEACDG